MEDSVTFLIDSSKRISGSTSDFTYQLNIPKNKQYDYVCVLQAIIPKSYYLIQAGLNTFTLQENGVNTTIVSIIMQIHSDNYVCFVNF